MPFSSVMSRGLLVSLEILDHGSDQLADLGREPDRAKSPFPHASTDMAAAEGIVLVGGQNVDLARRSGRKFAAEAEVDAER